MKVIVDSGVFFSAVIAPYGKTAELLLRPDLDLEKNGCHYVVVELFKHADRIQAASKQSRDHVIELVYRCVRQVTFINEEGIAVDTWKKAERLTKNVDHQDIAHVALCIHLGDDYFLWTGDKKLKLGLERNGFSRVLTTTDLYSLLIGDA
ncbi:MAG: PIN domain-containing protein [Bacteroidota bacterium]